MNIGTKDLGDSTFSNIIRIKDIGTIYQHLILDGPKPMYTIYYPVTLNNGKSKMNLITVPSWKDNPFSLFCEINEGLTRKQIEAKKGSDEASKYWCPLRPNLTYNALVMDKKQSIPVINMASYTKEIKNGIKTVWDAPSPKDVTKMDYGFSWMITLGITKELKKPEKGISPNNITYKVRQINSPEKYRGVIPMALAKDTTLTVNIDEKVGFIVKSKQYNKEMKVPYKDIFNDEEWSAIVNCQLELDVLIAPMNEKEVQDKLIANPPLLHGLNAQSQPFMLNWKETLDEMTKRKLILPPVSDMSTGYLPERSAVQQPVQQATGTEDKATVEHTNPDVLAFLNDSPAVEQKTTEIQNEDDWDVI